MTDVAPSLPSVKRAMTAAHNIRSWVHRYSKLHPEPHEPEWGDFESNRVSWVLSALDILERELAHADEAIGYHLPRHQPQPTPKQSLNAHQLRNANTAVDQLKLWSQKVRWSGLLSVTPADMDQLDAITKNMGDNLCHLLAQAQEQELAR